MDRELDGHQSGQVPGDVWLSTPKYERDCIRKSSFCYISSYSTIYANIVSIVPIVSKGNPPSIGDIIVLYITYSSTLTINANIVDLK